MKQRKTITLSMILYELRNVTGNPFVHIFGVGMPVMMVILITRISIMEIPDASADRRRTWKKEFRNVCTCLG